MTLEPIDVEFHVDPRDHEIVVSMVLRHTRPSSPPFEAVSVRTVDG